MKIHIRQKLTPTRLPIYITITLLILTSTLTSHIPIAMFVRADEGVGGDENLVTPTSSSPSIANKDLDWNLGPQMAILNSTTSTSCLPIPIQSVSSSEDDDDDDDEDQDVDDDKMNVLDGDIETEWSVSDLGTYLQLDLGKVNKICSVDASWSEGDEKSVNFVLSVSKDGTKFEDVLRSSSSGTTESKENYKFSTSDGRYLRITFYGDSENNEDVALRELTVNAENQNKKPTTVPGVSREGIPFIKDSQSPITFYNNATNNNEPIIHSAPIVSDIHAMVSPAASFEITLNGSDLDLVDHLTYYITNLPDHGNLTTGTNSASVKYTPFEGYSGLDSFKYKAIDQFGLTSNNATVVMNINSSNQSIAPLPNTLNKTIAPEPQSKFNPLEEAILGTKNDRYELIKAAREPIRGQYIVVLKPEPTATSGSDSARMRADEVRAMAEESRTKGAEILNLYEHALDGYVMKTSENASDAGLVSELRQDPRVAFVEPDHRVHVFNQTIPVGVDRVDGDASPTLSGDGGGAVDADIAILDTGIDLTHPDLNVYHEKTFVSGTASADDDNGHGTHVAGIAAAKDNSLGVVGIAPGARLWSIKVLNSSGAGSISDIIAGIDYVTAHSNEIDVVNLSFGCECSSPALDAAISNAVHSGIVFVVAAGNNHKDASSFTPARNPIVIAVSAMTDSDGKCGGVGSSTKYGNDDTFASFSNYGEPVDIVAPGVGILSTYRDGNYAQLSGTSMAAPHVTGGIALYESLHPGATPAQVRAAVIDSGTKPSAGCNGEGQGYFTGNPDGANTPLLNAKGL
jgi:subtilisin family serine protease